MKEITLNGAKFRVAANTMEELKNEALGDENGEIYKFLAKFNASEPDIFILDGFATKENLEIKDSSNVVFIRRGAMPGREVLKAMIASRNSPELNAALASGCVGVAGLGGLGSNIALSLARTGVAKLVLADFDVVEPSNLNRQQYFVRHIGMKKTDALKELIAEVNPFVEVETHDITLTAANVAEIFAPCSVICEAFDNVAGKAMMVNEAGASLRDKKIVGASGMAGHFSSNLIKTVKFARNVYLCGDLQNAAGVGQGLMAARVAICANHQANLAIRLLMGLEEV
ncbi:thiamine biosynthesis protein ThiF [Campylobacter rectus RM3267]|uniref:ThiS adenylyltransferase n=2 Tax=Campylobacter rectus TaxID=203 RepID=A0A6G5QJS4_CAMRE|nr:sulfur carrier protein ThiS adenylyltransferase ThiF [Campylobacter rectus]EEF12724.1 thiamine biosynthesis protein ThiF [Campylobacter rectus RM3267]QCD45948.1 ThiS adenylyltransferase [Campylobacter rectus]UEB46661.1 sulfur carrier protein ThiS adenylyltransferase ThiF [Campylobacter rectus]